VTLNQDICQMKLIVDQGNTLIKLALFDVSNQLIEMSSNKNWELVIEKWCNEFSIDQVIFSSVGENAKIIQSYLENKFQKVLILTNATQIQLPNRYQTPETLGVDRIANAAYAIYSKQFPALIIDCGTCLKFDVVNEKGEYLGGSISPGLKMRCRAMHEFTAKLPLVQPIVDEVPTLIGVTTESSLLSGSYLGMLHEIEHTISRYQELFKEINIFLTGGDAEYFVKALKKGIFADPFLTLKGLNEILNCS
jgi:type III pantothenate kinase